VEEFGDTGAISQNTREREHFHNQCEDYNLTTQLQTEQQPYKNLKGGIKQAY